MRKVLSFPAYPVGVVPKYHVVFDIYVADESFLQVTQKFGARCRFDEQHTLKRSRVASGCTEEELQEMLDSQSREFSSKFYDNFSDGFRPVMLFRHIKETCDHIRKVRALKEPLAFICRAGKSRSTSMAIATMITLNYLGELEKRQWVDPAIKEALSSPTLSCYDSISRVITRMQTNQFVGGREKKDLVYPNFWFRFQLAVFKSYLDNGLVLNEGEFKKIAADFTAFLKVNKVPVDACGSDAKHHIAIASETVLDDRCTSTQIFEMFKTGLDSLNVFFQHVKA